jgi:hypothetical protein
MTRLLYARRRTRAAGFGLSRACAAAADASEVHEVRSFGGARTGAGGVVITQERPASRVMNERPFERSISSGKSRHRIALRISASSTRSLRDCADTHASAFAVYRTRSLGSYEMIANGSSSLGMTLNEPAAERERSACLALLPA